MPSPGQCPRIVELGTEGELEVVFPRSLEGSPLVSGTSLGPRGVSRLLLCPAGATLPVCDSAVCLSLNEFSLFVQLRGRASQGGSWAGGFTGGLCWAGWALRGLEPGCSGRFSGLLLMAPLCYHLAVFLGPLSVWLQACLRRLSALLSFCLGDHARPCLLGALVGGLAALLLMSFAAACCLGRAGPCAACSNAPSFPSPARLPPSGQLAPPLLLPLGGSPSPSRSEHLQTLVGVCSRWARWHSGGVDSD